MAIATTKTTVETPGHAAEGFDRVFEVSIRPGGLDHYLAMVDETNRGPRLKCYDESILLVSPGVPHEQASEKIALLVAAICGVLKIPCRPYASTLFRRPGEDKGIEADKSYYIGNLAAVRGRPTIDLDVDPPPDLIVEIVDSHKATKSLSFGLDIGVPEIWVYEIRKRRMEILTLRRPRNAPACYRPSKKSRSFPFLTSDDVTPWLAGHDSDLDVFVRDAFKWVRAELAPRLRRPKPPKPKD